MNPFLATDGYKTGHHKMYPKGTTLVYSNFTPRSAKHAPKGVEEVVVFGTQLTVQQINKSFATYFFTQPKENVIAEIQAEYKMYLGADYDTKHIEALHDLGYLPIKVKALPEGTLAPMGVPVLTIVNTKPEFYWVTNFLETLLSNLLWKPMTSATIAHTYKKLLTKWALKTDPAAIGFVEFQGHDFSMRGMDSVDATMASGLGHATSFMGSDSLPVIHGARHYYGEEGFVVGSVNATEHSVMCAGSKDDEIGTFRHLMDQFPTGILSIVSDTWDLWTVITKYLPELKEEILARDGKIVIRPDSGDPVDIITGILDYTKLGGVEGFENDRKLRDGSPDPNYSPEAKGVIELLWDIFGGTTNEQGYKVLDPHIGAIYGDSITLDRAEAICERLEAKGFASTNVVLGIGSFTYQFNTRDTFGFAMKATYVEINGVGREIFKDPVTDDGAKKSAKGLLQVADDADGNLTLHDQVTWKEEGLGALQTIFEDGMFTNYTTLTEIRAKLQEVVTHGKQTHHV